MTTIPSSHVSWNKIWVVIGALLVPGLTVGTMIIRGGQQLVDKVDVVIIKQDKTDNRMDRLEEKMNVVSTRVDTISHRQEINTLKQDYRFQLQQRGSSPTVYRPYRQTYATQHRDADGNVTMVK